MNLADGIALARAVAVLPVIVLVATGSDTLALVVFAAAALSDAIDGPVARARDEVTARGEWLDPLADKVLIAGTLAALAARGLVPLWALVIVLGRELAAMDPAESLWIAGAQPAGLTSGTFYGRFRRYLRQAGLSPTGLHILRHTAAMRLLHAGTDIAVIALWLGHEQIRTAQTYLHADMAQKERAIARVTPPGTAPGRYRPPDPLLAFLNGL